MHRTIISILALADLFRHRLQSRILPADKALGAKGEDLAHRFLQRRGYTILARNYRTPTGHREVDIIAWQKDSELNSPAPLESSSTGHEHNGLGRGILVIVEVKTRRTEGYLPVERAVDREKRGNLVHAAFAYIRRADVPWRKVRFDTISVVLEPQPLIRHTPDAFHPDRSRFDRPSYAAEMDE